MNNLALLAGSGLLSAGVALGVVMLFQPAPPQTAGSGELALQQVDALTRQQRQMQEQIERLREGMQEAFVQASRTEAPRITDQQVTAALARYLEAHGEVLPVEAAAESEEFDLESTFAELLGTNVWEDEGLWRRVHETGRFDEVLERFRQHAKANPDSADAQVELANALLARLQFEPQKWPLAVEADRAFDSALETDEGHWQARFSKAVSYTFWPDFLGKKPEAIRHFETLIGQQEAAAPQEHFAQTYLFLGNLYAQSGNQEKAREIWSRGSRLYPQVDELRQKLQ